MAFERVITLPKDPELARLLRGSGGLHERLLNWMSSAADPGSGSSPVVTLAGMPKAAGHVSEAEGVTEDVIALLARARAAGDPAADALAKVAAQLGVSEPGPEPG